MEILFKEFMRLDLRVGEVIEAEQIAARATKEVHGHRIPVHDLRRRG